MYKIVKILGKRGSSRYFMQSSTYCEQQIQ